MVVINQGLNIQSNVRVNEGPLPIKQGDVSPILIKERLNNQEAKVVLKGQEVQVKFDGPIPSQDRIIVEVIKQNDHGQVVVRPVPNQTAQPAPPKTVDDLLVKLGFDPRTHMELKEAVKQILANGGIVSKDSLIVLQDFFKNEIGPLNEKLDTIKIMQQKNIEFTKVQLHSIHTALHGKPLGEILQAVIGTPTEIQTNVPLGDKVKQILKEIQKEPEMDKVIALIKDRLLSQPELSAKLKSVMEKGIHDAVRLASIGQKGMGKAAIVQALVSAEKQTSPEIPKTNHEAIFMDNERQSIKPMKNPGQNGIESRINRFESSIMEILSSLDPVKDKETIAEIKKALQIQQAGKERIVQTLSNLGISVQPDSNLSTIIDKAQSNEIPAEFKGKIEIAIQEALKLDKIGTARLEAVLPKLQVPTESVIALQNAEEPMDNFRNSTDKLILEAAKLIQKEPSMAKVLEDLKTFMIPELKAPIEKASQQMLQGRELAARKELANAISKFEIPKQTNTDLSLSKAEQYLINEAIQSLQLNSKDLLVTQITKKLSQLAIDFKKVRQEMSQNLDTASRLMEGKSPGSAIPVKQMLEETISKLDKTILKGNFMLYTDMETEKKMLMASSQLAEAKNHLAKGNLTDANKIVKEVKNVLDQLIFKPSDNRVKHFVSVKEFLPQASQEESTPRSMFEKATSPITDHEQGPRFLFEKIQALGFTHEIDSTQALIDKQSQPHNLKSLLLQMMDSDRANQHVEQAIANITGQQLLNKQDPSGMQNLFLQLPILLNKQVENVKVYVNSQKQGKKIDWENCSLYFVLETKKLGEVGILVSAVKRNLSITFKNNRDGLKEMMQPLVEVTKDRLQEIGYNVGALQFKSFSENSKTEDKPVAKAATFTEKGYDFSI
jgi:hypothetical protein